jgi:hypothetical protein
LIIRNSAKLPQCSLLERRQVCSPAFFIGVFFERGLTMQLTASIVVADDALKAGETSLVTITFSEAVSGFDNSDLTVEGGSLTAVSSGDGGVTWTAIFTPTVDTTPPAT